MQTTATITVTAMIITKNIEKIDSRCGDCFLKTYQKLFVKFHISRKQQQGFFKYLEDLLVSDKFSSSPEIQRKLAIKFSHISGITDSFVIEKQVSNRLASQLYIDWKPNVEKSRHPFELALKLSIAANIMDYGANSTFNVHKTIHEVLTTDFAIDHSNELKQQISRAKSILYLGDNAGEIVFDKLFIETIRHPNLTFVVRGGAALNDATLKDVEEIKMTEVTKKVITNGFDAPSTVLKNCSAEFIEAYTSADVIIAKGQGNLEGLINEQDPRIFFILMAKCDVMAELIKVKKGSFVVLNLTKEV